MIVKWICENGIVGGTISGEVEIDDDLTDDEIAAAVREDVFNYVTWSWAKPGQPGYDDFE